MEELIAVGIGLGIFGMACLIGWGAGVLIDVRWKYLVKKNRANHPKLIELQKEREKVCKEYNRWWDEKYEAQKHIDKNFEILKYCTEEAKKKYLASIEQDQQIYTNADKHMKELSPLVDSAREAEQAYREEHNIRHW